MSPHRRATGPLFALLCVIFAVGCSTAPLCDFLDLACPGRMPKGKVPPHGGVCAPGQGTIPIVQPVVPPPITNLPTTPPVTVPVVPGPVPPPSSGPFTPTPTIPPPPPPPPQK